jgi:hypothetical protein
VAKSFPNTGATVIDTVADLPAASAALEGVMMFQKDTNELKICDGASWISMLDTDTPLIPTSGTTAAISLASASSVTLPSNTSIGNVSSTELGYLDNVTSAIQTQINGRFDTARLKAGRTTIGAGAGQITVTFPSAFANTNFTLVVSGNRGTSDNPAMVWTSDITASNFIVYARNPAQGLVGGTCIINWMAIAD